MIELMLGAILGLVLWGLFNKQIRRLGCALLGHGKPWPHTNECCQCDQPIPKSE